METCPQCGASVRAGARFCLTCGAAMTAPPPPAAPAWPEQPPQAPTYRPPAASPPAPPAYQPARPPAAQPDAWQQPAPQPDPWQPAQPPVPATTRPPAQPGAWQQSPQQPAQQPNSWQPAQPQAAWQPAEPPPQPPPQRPAPTVEATELERAMAGAKSYIAPAVLVFYLYFLFYIPGLIINRMYLAEAREMERIAGRTLPGTGCLSTLLWLGILPGVLLLVLIIVAFLGGALGNLF